jgi:drug/metabolite transporter (DMT)-like permease
MAQAPGSSGPGLRGTRPALLMAWAALVVVYIVWGSTYLAIRVGVRDLPPALMAGLRYLAAGAILFPIASRTGRRPAGADAAEPDPGRGEAPPRASTGAPAPGAPGAARGRRPGWREWAGCTVVGVLLLAGGNGAVTLAEKSLDSGLAAVLVATVPLWMVVFALPLERQRVTGRAAAGLAAGLVGVAVLAGGGSAGGHLGGVLLVLGAAASWGLGSVLGRRLRLPRRALLAAAMEMLAGGTVLVIIALASGEAGQAHWGQVSPTAWLALAWLVLPGSILAFTAYGYALARLPLATVSTYAYVNPVVAVLLGAGLLHERLTGRELLGTLLVVASVAVTLHHPARPKRPAGPPGGPDAPGLARPNQPECLPPGRPGTLRDL